MRCHSVVMTNYHKSTTWLNDIPRLTSCSATYIVLHNPTHRASSMANNSILVVFVEYSFLTHIRVLLTKSFTFVLKVVHK